MFCAPARIRTRNTTSEASRDIRFTTGAANSIIRLIPQLSIFVHGIIIGQGLWYSGSTPHSHCGDGSSILPRSTNVYNYTYKRATYWGGSFFWFQDCDKLQSRQRTSGGSPIASTRSSIVLYSRLLMPKNLILSLFEGNRLAKSSSSLVVFPQGQ